MDQEGGTHLGAAVGPTDQAEYLKQRASVSKAASQAHSETVLGELQRPMEDLGVSSESGMCNPIPIPQADTVKDELDYSSPSSGSSKLVSFQNSGVSVEDRTRTLHFSLGNGANNKRSSIYESKSTVTAIPIRTPKTHEFDDIASTKSVSSSLTASFSRNFLYGFYNTKKGQPRNRAILSKDYWMKDESAKECFACTKTFNTFRRKHHCRICGQIFCSNCTFLVHGDRFGYSGKMRICNGCSEHANNYEDSSDESSVDETSHVDQVSTTHIDPVNALHDDDMQSILTTGEDPRFLITPTPPPKMAIPATRQGESLEISFPSASGTNHHYPHFSYYHSNHHGHNHQENMHRQRRSNRDRYSLRDVDILSPITQESNSTLLQSSAQRSNSNIRSLQLGNLRQSLTSYINGHNNSAYAPLLPKQQTQAPNSIIGNGGHSTFKFEFNYGNDAPSAPKPAVHFQTSPSGTMLSPDPHDQPDDNCSEDEGSMSLYCSLNEPRASHQNPIRSLRNTSKSSQRAQASLQRMRSRRKSRSKSISVYNTGGKDTSILNYSAPNLLSVVSSDTELCSRTKDVSNLLRPRLWNEVLSSRDLRRVISSSSAFRLVSREGKSDLNEVSALHIDALLKQVLNDQELPTLSEWEKIFQPFLLKVQAVHLDARKLDDLDFKQHYLKIKRIAGGKIHDSCLLHGIVYSKGLPLKSMPRELHNPRILLIMFPLEYQKSENQLLSLVSVMAQEKEYLNKLVSRLTSLNPDIIFVGANVSGYALKILNDLGIVVQYNVKPQVIERIAKLTESDIAISVDKLATNIKLGTCEKFEVQSFIYQNLSKTYSFLTGCKPSLGATIVLRGEDNLTLRKIKDVTEFMVYSVFCLRLESSFFNDNFLQLSTAVYKDREAKRRNVVATGYFANFMDKYNARIFSVSPTVEFPEPYLLRKARELEAKLNQKLEELKQLEQSNNPKNLAIGLHIEGLNAQLLRPQDYSYLIKFIQEKEIEDLQLKFQRRKRQWEVSYSSSQNLLGTGSHQNITVLYSVISTKTATPCIGPQLVTIDYFWDNDVSMGQFIENVVATAYKPCGHSCGGLMLDHYRSYVHGNGKVDVLIEKFQSKIPLIQNIIFSWSYCKKCGNTTPTIQMSDRTWNYSLGKYLELLFWNTRDGLLGIGSCSHDFSKDHIRYFRLNDSIVRMEYSDIEVHELITPCPKITWRPHMDIKLKIESYYLILDKINAFYFSVIDRLDRVKLDSLPEDRMQSGQAKISELKAKAEDEKKQLIQYVDIIYRDTPGDKHLHMNATIRALHNNAAGWDADFSEFEKKFLPTDKDIARVTALQLKKLFVDSKREEKPTTDADKYKDSNIEGIPEEFSSDGLDQDASVEQSQLQDMPEVKMGDSTKPSASNSAKSHVLQRSRGSQGSQLSTHSQSSQSSHNSSRSLQLTEGSQLSRNSRGSQGSKGSLASKGSQPMLNVEPLDPEYLKRTSKEHYHVSTLEPLKQTLKDERKKSRVLDEAYKFEELIRQTSETQVPRCPFAGSQTAPVLRTIGTTVPSPEEYGNTNSSTKAETAHKDIRPALKDLRKLSMSSNNSSITQRSKDFPTDGKVGQLASFFDQIHFDALSKEFELQREMERLQMNKNKYKAMRVKSSKPIVEVYKNVKDAVDGPMKEETRNSTKMSVGNNTILNHHATQPFQNDLGTTSPEAVITEMPLRKGLETELENSIHLWSESILHANKQKDTKSTELLSGSNKNTQNEPLPPVTTTATVNMDNSSVPAPSEKLSLMKTLANFWADRSSTSWKPLEYPTTQSEHIFMDNAVIIREDEPSSLIAFCLSCSDYVKKINNMRSFGPGRPDSEICNMKQKKGLENESRRSFTESLDEAPDTESASPAIAADAEPLDLEKIMTKKTGMHLRYQFQDGSSVMSCKIFFYEQFEAFRRRCGCGDENFIQSLSRCVKWDSTGGKSGSAFLKTLDDRFVIKELSHAEIDAFVKFAPSYFEYMGQALFHELPTALAKIFGFFQIQIRNSATGKSFKMDVIIMENLFYDKKTTRIFDLKGTMRNRHVEQTGKENEVLLDENMVEYIYESPIFVREYDKRLLRASLWNDTLFLAKMNVMDYSLVIGVDNENHNLTVGIIDCIRTFTWDKKLESWVKEKGLVGGSTKEPTVVTPRQYKNRFREAMERYILMVPDPWYQEPHK